MAAKAAIGLKGLMYYVITGRIKGAARAVLSILRTVG